VNVPNPDGTRQACGSCGQPTVLAEPIPGQQERVHCGTHQARCHTTTRRRTR
jgi:ribosomal protein S27AE